MNNITRPAAWLTAAGALALAAAPAAAQVTIIPRALGTAGAFMADARGQEALHINPALLGLHGTPYWSVSLPQLAVGTQFTGTRLGRVWALPHFNKWSQAEKDDFVGGIPGAGLGSTLDVRVPFASIGYRRFAFGVSYAASYRENVGRDVVDLLINGYQPGRTDYAVGNTRGTSASWLDFSGAFGHRVGPVSLGVTGHWLRGRQLSQNQLFEPTFDIEAQDIHTELREVLVHGGSGYSVDFGMAMEATPKLTLSASVANAFSQLKWAEQVSTRFVTLSRDDFHKNAALDALDRLGQSETTVDPGAVPMTVYETARGLYDGAWLPPTLKAGAAYAATPRTHVSAAYQGALDEGRLGTAWRRQLSAGVEHTRGLLGVRTGVGTDLSGALMLAGGVSVGGIHLGLAHTSAPVDGSGRSSGWTASFGLSARNISPMP